MSHLPICSYTMVVPLKHLGDPYDTEARNGKKCKTTWVGYKFHVMETCDEESPHLITHVATRISPSADDTVTMQIHEDLKQSDLLPSHYWLDAGYVTGKNLVNSSQDFGLQTVGPTRANHNRSSCRLAAGYSPRSQTLFLTGFVGRIEDDGEPDFP